MAGIRIDRIPEPCAIIIIGATGDLTKRKLIPALYNLSRQNLLPAGFYILGASRPSMSTEDFRAAMQAAVQEFSEEGIGDLAVWQTFVSRVHYLTLDTDRPETGHQLKLTVEQLDQQYGTGKNRLFYLAVPPVAFAACIRMLESNQLNREEGGWTRIIVEKPFGNDLDSARALNQETLRVFREEQIYRIDHYLGKETVQNIMVLRFANGMFEPLWNQRYIDHVQITAAESIGVENRGGYYEQAGALRDMIQNHMLQLLTLVAMEPPVAIEAKAVRDEKTKVLRSIRPIEKQNLDRFALRAQYQEGSIGGEAVSGYRSENGVDRSSNVETFAIVKFFIDNWRWADVPFYLRSGKRLPKRVTEIAIQYKRVPYLLFPDQAENLQPDFLILRIQPEEGISLKFCAKLPGQQIKIRQVSMDFQYGTSFGKRSPEAYERLLLDAMMGDSTHFARADFVELSWQLITPLMEAWRESPSSLLNYAAGSWGPPEADAFIERDGKEWRRP